MKHTKSGTKVEVGDPFYTDLLIGNCPKCGAELPNAHWLTGGHLSSGTLSIGKLLFAACYNCFEEAHNGLFKKESKQEAGYQGEWEPRFGLVARVTYKTADSLADDRDEYVRIIDGSKFNAASITD